MNPLYKVVRPYSGAKMIGLNIETQLAFRGREDDGVESLQESDGGATWEAGLNTDYSWQIGKRTRIRILVTRISAAAMWRRRLFANYNGAGYTQVNNSHSHVRLESTQYFLDGDSSTDFTGRVGTGTWNPDSSANLSSADGARTGPTNYLGSERDMEVEFCLRLVQENVVPGNTVLLRLHRDSGQALTSYINTPELTIAAPDQDVFVN